MKTIYVAGAYSADNVISILDNMRIGMRAATDILLAGHAPFCPWADFHFHLMLRSGETLTVDHYYEYSLAWLRKSDAVFVVDNPANLYSKGLLAELEEAMKLKIPIFYSLESLNGWANAKIN